jgi:hypothetical protein
MGLPTKADRIEEEDIGDVISLASNMFVFFNKSKIYIRWEKSRLDLTFRTLTPRK